MELRLSAILAVDVFDRNHVIGEGETSEIASVLA